MINTKTIEQNLEGTFWRSRKTPMSKIPKTRKVLLKDLVIPAGTVFSAAATKVERAPGCYVETSIGLTPNTCGFLTYEIDDSELSEWFGNAED